MKNNLGDFRDLAHNMKCCFTDLQIQFKTNFPIRPLSSSERKNIWGIIRDSFESTIGNIESLWESTDAVFGRLQNIEENFLGSESVSRKIQNHLAKLKVKIPDSLLNNEIQKASTSGQEKPANYPAISYEHSNSENKFVQDEMPKSVSQDVQNVSADTEGDKNAI